MTGIAADFSQHRNNRHYYVERAAAWLAGRNRHHGGVTGAPGGLASGEVRRPACSLILILYLYRRNDQQVAYHREEGAQRPRAT